MASERDPHEELQRQIAAWNARAEADRPDWRGRAERAETRAEVAEAALAEVRDLADEMLAWADRNHELVRDRDFHRKLTRSLAALPANLAAERDARIRAEAAADALDAAAAALPPGESPEDRCPMRPRSWLRGRAAEIRGGR